MPNVTTRQLNKGCFQEILVCASRVRRSARVHDFYLRGRLLGTATEGAESCYFRGPSGRGRLYASMTALDATVARLARRTS